MAAPKRKGRFIRDLLSILPILFMAICTVGYIMLFRHGQSRVDPQVAEVQKGIITRGDETSEQVKGYSGQKETTEDKGASVPAGGESKGKLSRGKVMFFTMDTLPGYQNAMKLGGPSGEYFARGCLEKYFESHGFEVTRITGDPMFDLIARYPDNFKSYDFFFFDPWTIITPQHVTRGKYPNMGDKVFVLSFFGETRYSAEVGIPLERYLTPYPNKHNTYIGFFINPPPSMRIYTGKKKGVIWGKEIRYVVKAADIIDRVSKDYRLFSSLYKYPDRKLSRSRVRWMGTLPKERWMALLADSSFLLGLGDPILGPSPMEAMALGCTFINIKFKNRRVIKPGIYAESQHDWLQEVASRDGTDQICTALEGNVEKILECAKLAVARNSTSTYLPKEVLRAEYDARLDKLFNLVAPEPV